MKKIQHGRDNDKELKKIKETDPETGKEIEKEDILFRPVNVFDHSQTKGEPLPEVDITVQGDSSLAMLQNLLEFCGQCQRRILLVEYIEQRTDK